MGKTNSKNTPPLYINWEKVSLALNEVTHKYAEHEGVSIEFIKLTESTRKTYDFRTTLMTLDRLTGKSRRVQWLEFWLSSRKLTYLKKIGDHDAVRAHLRQMKSEFFSKGNNIDLLSGQEVHDACKTVCTHETVEYIKPIKIAQFNVGRRLDELRKGCCFMVTRDKSTQTPDTNWPYCDIIQTPNATPDLLATLR